MSGNSSVAISDGSVTVQFYGLHLQMVQYADNVLAYHLLGFQQTYIKLLLVLVINR
jgi:hypothetical protein